MKERLPEGSLAHAPLTHFFRHPTEEEVRIPGRRKEDEEKGLHLKREQDKHQPGTFIKKIE